jgi:hypothetical protein
VSRVGARTPSPSTSLLLSAFRLFLLSSRPYEPLSSRGASKILGNYSQKI